MTADLEPPSSPLFVPGMDVRTERVGPLPLVEHVLERMGLPALL